MAAAAGPKINRDALVLVFDRTNAKSWKGPPGNNLISLNGENTYSNINTADSSFGPRELVDFETPFGNQAWKITFKQNAQNGFRPDNPARFTSNSVTYFGDGIDYLKYSVWVYTDNWNGWNNDVYKYVTGSAGMPGFYDSALRRFDNKNREWRLYHRQNGFRDGQRNYSEYHTFFKNGTLESDLIVYLAAPTFFIEPNDSYVPFFTPTSRSTDETLYDLNNQTNIIPRNLSYDLDYNFEFDGTDDYIDIYPDLTRPNQLTCQGWIYPENQYARFATPQINGIDNWIGYNNGNQRLELQYCQSADTNNRRKYSATGDVPYQTWTNFAIAIDDRDWYIWINGELKNSGTESFQIGSWDSRWEIGQRGNGSSYFRGKLYYLSIYDRLLTDNEVLDNYAATRSRFANL